MIAPIALVVLCLCGEGGAERSAADLRKHMGYET